MNNKRKYITTDEGIMYVANLYVSQSIMHAINALADTQKNAEKDGHTLTLEDVLNFLQWVGKQHAEKAVSLRKNVEAKGEHLVEEYNE